MNVLRTRIRCADQSTSRQRRPSSSDWRRPVIAAVRISDAQDGTEHVRRRRRRRAAPAAPRWRGLAHDGLVRDRADHRLELLHRQELQVRLGIAGALAARTARRAAPGSRRTSRSSIACSKTLCRNVEHVADRLRAPPVLEHPLGERFDLLALDRGDAARCRGPARCAPAASTRSPRGRTCAQPCIASLRRSESAASCDRRAAGEHRPRRELLGLAGLPNSRSASVRVSPSRCRARGQGRVAGSAGDRRSSATARTRRRTSHRGGPCRSCASPSRSYTRPRGRRCAAGAQLADRPCTPARVQRRARRSVTSTSRIHTSSASRR